MSVIGYLIRRGPEWRMRRDDAGRDELGIKVEGLVLAGEKSLGERRAEDSAIAGKGDEEFYSALEDYDPVLKSHCRNAATTSLLRR